MATKVVLDVYSGFKNPAWELDAGQENEFGERLHSLGQPEDQETGQPAGLGYRGFEIQTPEQVESNEVTAIYGGTVRHEGKTYRDAGRTFEKWLLQTAPSSVSEKLISKVSAKIGQD